MYAVFTASRLMKASEVRKIYEEMRNNPDIIGSLEAKAKEKLKQRFGKKKKQQANRSLPLLKSALDLKSLYHHLQYKASSAS
jgi:hypothetical protein